MRADRKTIPVTLLLAALAGFPAAARAQDRFVFQVRDGFVDEPLRARVLLHSSYTIQGSDEFGWSGETPTDMSARFALEPSLAATEFLEVGARVMGMVTSGHGVEFGGASLRALGVVPRRLLGPFDAGLEVAASWSPIEVAPTPWGLELRPVLGWRSRVVGVWLNPIVRIPLTGSDGGRARFDPAARVSFNTQQGVALGAEYYAGLGPIDQGLLAPADQSHLVFACLDLAPPWGEEPGPWIFNFGAGMGLTDGTPQKWIVKAIFGRSF